MAESERLIPGRVIISTAAGACALLLTFSPLMCQMTVAHGTLAGRGEYWSRKREEMYCQLLRKVPMSKKKILLINPAFTDSLWGFTRIHSLVGIQYGFLPLGRVPTGCG